MTTNGIKVSCYGVIPAEVRYDKNLSDKAKLLYAELTAAANSFGMCEESNDILAYLLCSDERTITRAITKLVEAGYVERVIYHKKRTLKLKGGVSTKEELPTIDLPPLDDKKEYCEKLLSRWEEKLSCKLYHHEEYYQPIRERLLTFTEEELDKALENRTSFLLTSDWHQEPQNKKHVTNIDLLLRNNTTVNKWLNAKYTEEETLEKNKPFKYT